ncbi:serine/arginine repetitive matrix protein 1 [Streptomyces zaomyceticus]|uniref:serine/arginine repetitive matrix protein 1 n=1 Tax=Streptomyces zaomyceticus TaxID=68286 RepID=UPI0033BDD74F
MNESEGAAAAAVGGSAPAPGGADPEQDSRRMRRLRPSVPLQPSGPPQLDFPPVKNGLDYLASVVKHLDETESEVTPSDVKYAVLHLQAAVEVLFKTRLLAEHWTLVFTHPGDATRKALDEATLKSVTPEQAITRLQNIAGVEISDKEAKALTRLTTDRNKLQHFGFTDNARAVEARAGEVLDFLIRFIDTELQPYLEPADRLETEIGLRDLREGLGNINSYVRKRMNRIAGELRKEGVESTTIECPACENVTLVLDEDPPVPPAGDGAFATCRFCSSFFEFGDLARRWLPLHWDDRGGLVPADTCPSCDQEALGTDVRVRSEPEPVYFCFACSYITKEIAPCDSCGKQIDPSLEPSAPLCRPCDEAREPDPESEYELPYEEPADYGFDENAEPPAYENSWFPVVLTKEEA